MDIIPFFPLQKVVFPGEQVRLHIYEERYKELMNECLDDLNRRWVLCPVIDGKLMPRASEMRLEGLSHSYPDGRMDVITRCVNIVRIHYYTDPVAGHLYPGGTVLPVPYSLEGSAGLRALFMQHLKRLHSRLDTGLENRLVDREEWNSFYYGHTIGLELQQEYELLCLEEEDTRLQTGIDHMRDLLRRIDRIELLRQRLQMNGNYQSYDSPDIHSDH